MARRISFAEAVTAITSFFYGDKDKALYWYMQKNPLFEGVSPYELVKAGQGKRLLQYMRSTQSENI